VPFIYTIYTIYHIYTIYTTYVSFICHTIYTIYTIYRGSADSITNLLVVRVLRQVVGYVQAWGEAEADNGSGSGSDSDIGTGAGAGAGAGLRIKPIPTPWVIGTSGRGSGVVLLGSGAAYGLLVYLRIYPVIYFPAFVAHLAAPVHPRMRGERHRGAVDISTADTSTGADSGTAADTDTAADTNTADTNTADTDTNTDTSTAPTPDSPVLAVAPTPPTYPTYTHTTYTHRTDLAPTSPTSPTSPTYTHTHRTYRTYRLRAALLFSLSTFSTTLLLGTLSYTLYGHPYIKNAILYHLTRQDHRHDQYTLNGLLSLFTYMAYGIRHTLTGLFYDI
jgi:hypothetical protein